MWRGRLARLLPQRDLPPPRLTGNSALPLQAPQASASSLRHSFEQPRPRSAMTHWALSYVVSGFLAFRRVVSTIRTTWRPKSLMLRRDLPAFDLIQFN